MLFLAALTLGMAAQVSALPILQLDIGGGSMKYTSFTIDASHLLAGTGLHMDLYSETYRRGDVDIDNFAPYSHDAEFMNTSTTTPEAVPEPTTLALMGFGLAGLAFASRRRRQA